MRTKTNQNVQKALFSNTKKFIVEQGSLGEPNNTVLALSINKRMERFGYTLDASALRALSTQTAEEMLETWQSLEDVLSDAVGASAFRDYDLLYKNFPEEVMEKSEAELYLNSMFYYAFAQSNDRNMHALAEAFMDSRQGVKQDRLPVLENFPRDLKIINKGTYDDYLNMMDARIHSLGMSEPQFREVQYFLQNDPLNFERIVANDTPFQSKETMVRIASLLYEQNPTNIRRISDMMKDSVDVLRFASYLSWCNGKTQNTVQLTSLDRNKKVEFKLTNPEKRLVQVLLNNCKNLYYDIWRQPELFERLKNRINPTANKHCPERVIKAFDNLSHNLKVDEHGRPILSVEKQIENAIDDINNNVSGAKVRLQNIANDFPGIFMANYINVVEKVNEKDRDFAIDLIHACENSSSIALRKMLTLKGQIEMQQRFNEAEKNKEPMAKVYKHSGDKYFVKTAKTKNISAQQLTRMADAVDMTAKMMVKGNQDLGKVFIDPELKNIKAPGRDVRDNSGNSTLTKYSQIQMDKTKDALLFGVTWEGSGRRSEYKDIDLSAVFMSEGYQSIGRISYYELKNEYGVHSGDMTTTREDKVGNSPSKATEAIYLDKKALQNSNVRYVIPTVQTYSVDSLKTVNNLRFVSMQRESISETQRHEMQNITMGQKPLVDQSGNLVFAGEIFAPETMENCIKIEADAQSAIPFVYDVQEDRIYWLDQPERNEKRLANIADGQSVQSVIMSEIELAKNNPYPNIYDLVDSFTRYNGVVVDNIKDADTVFLKDQADREELGIQEHARIITSHELDVISDEFSGNKVVETKEQDLEQTKVETQEVSMEEPALVKQMRFFQKKLEAYPFGVRTELRTRNIDAMERER